MFLSANVVSTENLGYLGSYPVTISYFFKWKKCLLLVQIGAILPYD